MSPGKNDGNFAMLWTTDTAAVGGVRVRGWQAAAAVAPERRVARGRPVRDDRGHLVDEPRRHRGARRADHTGRAPAAWALSAAAPDPRWTERPGRPRVLVRAGTVRRQRLRGARGELPRQRRPRGGLPEGHLRRLGPQGSHGPARRSRSGGQAGRRGSRPARHRRLELRRDPDRLHDRDRHAVQGRDQRRRQREPARDVRAGRIHHPVGTEVGLPWKAPTSG